jgi:hypothetical protein
MLIISLDTLIVVDTSAIGLSGIPTVELPEKVMVQFS